MRRDCTHCRRPFAAADLMREASRNMEAERKAAGLEGVRFLYYHCPGCETDDIFVDILRRKGEPDADYQARRDDMESIVRQMHADHVEAVVTPARHS